MTEDYNVNTVPLAVIYDDGSITVHLKSVEDQVLHFKTNQKPSPKVPSPAPYSQAPDCRCAMIGCDGAAVLSMCPFLR